MGKVLVEVSFSAAKITDAQMRADLTCNVIRQTAIQEREDVV